jgi:hypothetical protein
MAGPETAIFHLAIAKERSLAAKPDGKRLAGWRRCVCWAVLVGMAAGAGWGQSLHPTHRDQTAMDGAPGDRGGAIDQNARGSESHLSEARHGAAKSARDFGKVALSFEPNRGQTSDAVQWVARGPEYALFLSGHDAVLELNSIAAKKGMTERPKIESAAVRMNLLGAKAVESAEGEDAQSGKANYFTGRDQAKWLSGVPMFGKVRLREVYPGIDLVYYGRQGRLEYDFVVAPGADPAKIALGFEGASAGLAANGDLVLPIAGGTSWEGEKEIRFDKPTVYQMKDGVRQPAR